MKYADGRYSIDFEDFERRISFAVSEGSEISERCPPSTYSMCAPARFAMNVNSAGGIARSWRPMRAQDGIVGHAFGLAQSSVVESWVPI